MGNVTNDKNSNGGNIRKAYTELEILVKKGIGDQEDQFNKKTVKNWLINNFQNKGTIPDAYNIVRKGGYVEVIGSRGDHILRPTGKFMETEVTSSGPWGGTPADAEAVLKSIKDGSIKPENLELLLGKEIAFTSEGFDQGVSIEKQRSHGKNLF